MLPMRAFWQSRKNRQLRFVNGCTFERARLRSIGGSAGRAGAMEPAEAFARGRRKLDINTASVLRYASLRARTPNALHRPSDACPRPSPAMA